MITFDSALYFPNRFYMHQQVNSLNNPVGQALSSLCYIKGNWGPKQSSSFPKSESKWKNWDLTPDFPISDFFLFL